MWRVGVYLNAGRTAVIARFPPTFVSPRLSVCRLLWVVWPLSPVHNNILPTTPAAPPPLLLSTPAQAAHQATSQRT